MTVRATIQELYVLIDQVMQKLGVLEQDIGSLSLPKRLQPIVFVTFDAPAFGTAPSQIEQQYGMAQCYNAAWADINAWLKGKIGKQLTIEPTMSVAGLRTQAEYMQAGAMSEIYREMQARKLIELYSPDIIYDTVVWGPSEELGPTGMWDDKPYGSSVAGVGQTMHGPAILKDLLGLPKEDLNATLWPGARSWGDMALGRMAHEAAGHCLGLGDIPQKPASEPQTIMDAWWIYPKLEFIPEQLEILNKSPFLK